jgi:hypothetical protein
MKVSKLKYLVHQFSDKWHEQIQYNSSRWNLILLPTMGIDSVAVLKSVCEYIYVCVCVCVCVCIKWNDIVIEILEIFITLSLPSEFQRMCVKNHWTPSMGMLTVLQMLTRCTVPWHVKRDMLLLSSLMITSVHMTVMGAYWLLTVALIPFLTVLVSSCYCIFIR